MWTERSMFSHLWKWWWFVVLKDFRFWQKIILFLSFHKTDDFYKRDEYQDPFYLFFLEFLLFMFQINLIAIMAMGRLYEYMAERLTVWGEFKSCSANFLILWSGSQTHSLGWVQKLFCMCDHWILKPGAFSVYWGTFIILLRQIRHFRIIYFKMIYIYHLLWEGFKFSQLSNLLRKVSIQIDFN